MWRAFRKPALSLWSLSICMRPSTQILAEVPGQGFYISRFTEGPQVATQLQTTQAQARADGAET